LTERDCLNLSVRRQGVSGKEVLAPKGKEEKGGSNKSDVLPMLFSGTKNVGRVKGRKLFFKMWIKEIKINNKGGGRGKRGAGFQDNNRQRSGNCKRCSTKATA